MKRKIFIVSISFCLGTIGGLYFNKNILLFFYLFLSLYLFVSKRNLFKSFLLIIFTISSIISYTKLRNTDMMLRNAKECVMIGKVCTIEKKEKLYRCEIKIIKSDVNKYINNKKVIAYVKNIQGLQVGDIIKIDATLEKFEEQRNKGGFDQKKYFLSKQIYARCYVDNLGLVKKANRVDGVVVLNSIRNHIKRALVSTLSEKSAAICEALILGEKQNIDEQITEEFSKSSLSHVLAVSGMHVAYIVSLTVFLTKFQGKVAVNFFVIIFIMLFCALSNGSESALRASIMSIIYFFSKIVHKKSDSITNLSIALVALLVINPFCIYSTGFLLSFCGTFGIIMFYKFITKKCISKKSNKFIKYVLSQNILSLSANIILIPIVCRIYNNLSISFIISSAIIGGLMNIIIPLIIGDIVLFFLCRPLSFFVSKILDATIKFLICFAKWLSKVKILNFKVTTPSLIFIFFYYTLVIAGYIFMNSESKDKYFVKKITIKIITVYVILTIIMKIFFIATNGLHIYFIDVGQGDSTLIVTEQNKSVLIDGGGSDGSNYIGKNILFPYLLDRKIKNIDYMIISHFDSDHSSGLEYIIKELNVKNVIIGKQFETCENYKKIVNVTKEKNIKINVVQAGNRINIGKNTYIDVLWPDPENIVGENLSNNNSLVCKLIYKDFSMLFTGDIEEKAEKDIFEKCKDKVSCLNCTVLKVAHHGSKTSSSKEFLKVVKPKVALIGVGKDNKFGHPSDITLKNLEDIKCKVYRTDEDGEIVLHVNKKGKIKINKMLNLK